MALAGNAFGAQEISDFNREVEPATSTTMREVTDQVRYRPDIDVLRAVAVLAVLGFHLIPNAVPGGFVGVDVFFVISGFLISRIIATDVERDRFSLVRFYERRIRRILPALYVVLIAALAAGWLLLLPTRMEDLAASAVAVTAFVSNILFWYWFGYFEAPAQEIILLHTWSLAVEEQFYVLFPLLMLLLYRVRPSRMAPFVVTLVLVLIAGASFATNIWQVNVAPASAFYLAQGRAWEFLIGSVLAVGRIPPLRHRGFRAVGIAAGLGMVMVAIFAFSARTAFPGVAALLPCLGAAVWLWANTERQPGPIERALTAPLVFYGTISYSLYLWHWPIWTFAKLVLRPSGDFPLSTKLAMFVFATALSFASYRLVEQPFRAPNKVGSRALFLSAGTVSGLLLLAGISGIMLQGFPGRFKPEIVALDRYAKYPREVPYREGVCFLQRDQGFNRYDLQTCATPKAGARNVLIWGDSVAAHYLPGLQRAARGYDLELLQANATQCAPFPYTQPVMPNCDPVNGVALKLLRSNSLAALIVSANWGGIVDTLGYDRLIASIRLTTDAAKAAGVPVILFGPSIQYLQRLPGLLTSLALDGADISLPMKLVKPELFDLDRRLAADFKGAAGVTYVSILAANCPEQICPVVINKNVPMAWDTIHLTVAGSDRVVTNVLPQMVEPFFGPLVKH